MLNSIRAKSERRGGKFDEKSLRTGMTNYTPRHKSIYAKEREVCGNAQKIP